MKLLQSDSRAVNLLLKTFANDRAIAKIDFAILHYNQQNSIIFIQHDDDLYAKSSKIADVYDKHTRDDIFIKGVGSTILQSDRK